jgi:hypothetical protein
MLFPKESFPVQIDSTKIPPDFLHHMRDQGCGETGCRSCGYCEETAAAALTIESSYLEDSIVRLREVRGSMISGSLWDA